MNNDRLVDKLQDRAEIQDILSRYCRGIDRLDEALIAACYWPEAEENHGIFNGNATDFAPFIVKFLEEAYTVTQHVLGQSCIELAGERAASETYFLAMHRCRAG